MKDISYRRWEGLKKFIGRQRDHALNFLESPTAAKCYKIILDQMEIVERVNETEEKPENNIYKKMWDNLKAGCWTDSDYVMTGRNIFDLMQSQETAWVLKKSGGERMNIVMEFPETVEEFMESYKMTDTEHIYSNGIEYVPIFRMKQWFEHIKASEETAQEWNARLTYRFKKYLNDMIDSAERGYRNEYCAGYHDALIAISAIWALMENDKDLERVRK